MNVKEIFQSIFDRFSLKGEEEDVNVIRESIEQGVVFRGTNLWILTFAILVASVGLNMNSTAVIIGAMLISPLMGPINGVGYSVATYNFALFKKSMKNLSFAVAAALGTSTLYFLLTPIHTEHSELLSRTSPTIYDVLIAIFGGLAGIVAISSKNKGNVIPGVAIATALMPPLCTAGYGLSIGNIGYFAGALYLFFINSVFIALSAMFVSQLMDFPKNTHLLSREIKNKNIAITILILITVVPSIFFGFSLVRKERFVAKADDFIESVGIWEGNYLLDSRVDGDASSIVLIYGGNEFDSYSEERLRDKADDLGLKGAKLYIKQGLKISDIGDLQNYANSAKSKQDTELSILKASIINQQKRMDSLVHIPEKGKELMNELKTLYPSIESCLYAPSYQYVDSTNTSELMNVVLFTASDSLTIEDRSKIKDWLKQRLGSNNIILKF